MYAPECGGQGGKPLNLPHKKCYHQHETPVPQAKYNPTILPPILAKAKPKGIAVVSQP